MQGSKLIAGIFRQGIIRRDIHEKEIMGGIFTTRTSLRIIPDKDTGSKS
jgi:predicted DNA-binding transcriptional regulator